MSLISLLKDGFQEYEILSRQFFSSSDLKTSSHCLLACIVCKNKVVCISCFYSLNVIYYISPLWLLLRLFPHPWLAYSPGVDFCMCVCVFKIHWPSWICEMSFQHIWKVPSSRFFLLPLSPRLLAPPGLLRPRMCFLRLFSFWATAGCGRRSQGGGGFSEFAHVDQKSHEIPD